MKNRPRVAFNGHGRILVLLSLLTLFTPFGPAGAQPAPKVNEPIARGDYDAAVAASEADTSHYLHELIEKARTAKLVDDPTWRALLHYKRGWWGGWESQVAGADFFLSKTGKTDPKAELEATLAAFFSELPVAPTENPPQCRFVARFHWLNQRLSFDPARLGIDPCPRYQGFRQTVDPDSVTVIFPSAHPNSPSSMFGHTSIRMDKKGQTKQTRMLAYTINYGAEARDENNLVYAIKGLTGGYPGRFSIVPYYVKLREYSQMENRDIWEYKLKLTQAQTDFILMHAYELAVSYFQYYFLTENCAYHVLSVIEAAMPEAGLTDAFPSWTIPVDTLKLLEEKGLVESVTYEPAHNTVIRKRREALNDTEKSLALRLFKTGAPADDNLEAMPTLRRAMVTDLLYDYLRFHRIANSDDVGTELAQREREVLLMRSKLRVASPPAVVETPGTRPDEGHETARIHFGAGTENGDGVADVGWRAAYHDLLDPSPGYTGHSQLEFFKVNARYYRETERLALESFELIDIVSLEPTDSFFRNTSWHVQTGVFSVPDAASHLHPRYFSLNGGGGRTVSADAQRKILLYGFIDGHINAGRAFEDDYQVSLGVSGGLVAQLAGPWRINLSASYMDGVAGDETETARVALEQGIALSKDVSMRVSLRRVKMLDDYTTQFMTQALFYH